MVLNRRSRIVLELRCNDSWGLSPLWALCCCGFRCMKLIFNPRSFPLNPDDSCQTLHQVSKMEVNLQTRGCSRNCFAQPCSSLSLALAKPSLWNHLNHEGIALGEFFHQYLCSSTNTRVWNPFGTSCRKSANKGFYNMLELWLAIPYSKSVVGPLSVFWQSSFIVHWGVLMHVILVVRPGNSTSGC